jgi:uncharacterized repeat protein (TIGR03803 family)
VTITFHQIVLLTAAGCAVPLGASAKALTPKILTSFTGTNGSQPQGALVADAAGNLYGTDQAGGSSNKGTVFELVKPAAGKKNWTAKVLLDFNGTNGSQPVAGLVFDKSGNLYGTALTGGASGDGVVFELAAPAKGKTKWTETLLHSFSGTDGLNVQAGVIFDAAGNLYGATLGGGASSAGTVFRLAPPAQGQTTWTLSTLIAFNGTSNGFTPTGTLILDKAGNLYGTTVSGGASNDGVAFELSPFSGGGTPWNETVLQSFGGTNGIHPYAGLVADGSGNVYGTTVAGGASGDGTVFKLTPPATGTETVLFSFSGANGNYPFANLTIDAKGNLFGATGGGGKSGEGTIYEVSPPPAGQTVWTEKVLTAFTGKNGASPSAAVLLDSAGNIYGTTVTGGARNDGNAFELTP